MSKTESGGRAVAAIGPLTIDSIYADFTGYPKQGEEKLAGSHSIQLGGGAAVIPIVLQRLGIPARLGTFLGEDKISHLAEQLLEELGCTSYVNLYHGKGQPVVLSTVFTFPEDRSFLSFIDQSAQAEADPEQAYAFLKEARICIAPEQEEVCRKLKQQGVCQVFDVHWTEDLSMEKYAGILANVDYFVPNEKEAFRMTGKENAEDALFELAKVTKQPIIKLGKDGCQTLLEGRVVSLPAVESFRPVDTTGAGDNFMAGLIYGLYKGWPLERCLQMANVFGGYAITGLGCFPKAFTEEEALGYLDGDKTLSGKGGRHDFT